MLSQTPAHKEKKAGQVALTGLSILQEDELALLVERLARASRLIAACRDLRFVHERSAVHVPRRRRRAIGTRRRDDELIAVPLRRCLRLAAPAHLDRGLG